jgi:hypothetical protein
VIIMDGAGWIGNPLTGVVKSLVRRATLGSRLLNTIQLAQRSLLFFTS